MRRSGTRLRAAAIACVLVLAGCGEGASLGQVSQPRDGRAGLQVTGRLGGTQIALSEGTPELVVGDCDPTDGSDADVCAIAGDIDGRVFVLSFENPDVLSPGATLPVGAPACRLRECDEAEDVAIVDVQSDVGPRVRARSGQVELREVQPYLRYAGTARLVLPDGRLNVDFDLVPGED